MEELAPQQAKHLSLLWRNQNPRLRNRDRLRWTAQDNITDWSIVIGQFYSFAAHRCYWHWCYLIWLDQDSPSSAWVSADIGWEDDLEPLEMEPRP